MDLLRATLCYVKITRFNAQAAKEQHKIGYEISFVILPVNENEALPANTHTQPQFTYTHTSCKYKPCQNLVIFINSFNTFVA